MRRLTRIFDTREDQIEALRILSAGNVIIIVLLGGILTLQAGEEYVRRIESKNEVKEGEKPKDTSADATTESTETKKNK